MDGWLQSSEPYGAGTLEHGHELAGEVQRHDLVGGADEPAADEEGGDGRRAAEAAGEPPAPSHGRAGPCRARAPPRTPPARRGGSSPCGTSGTGSS